MPVENIKIAYYQIHKGAATVKYIVCTDIIILSTDTIKRRFRLGIQIICGRLQLIDPSSPCSYFYLLIASYVSVSSLDDL